jgi:hypothetical protein
MSRFTMPFVQWMDGNGNPLTGGELFFYDFGTTNPKDTFSDAGLTTPNTNPVVAGGVGDANGVWGAIFLGAGDYTVVLKDEDGNTVWTSGAQPVSADASGVTSVALTMPTAIFDVAGSPVTGSGTLAVTLDTQTANTLFAGPTTGAAAAPTFRAMVLADLPVGGSTAGQILTSTGAATPPAWQTRGAGWEYINAFTATNSATLDITGLTSTAYSEFMLTVENLLPATDDVELRLRTSIDAGSTFAATSYLSVCSYNVAGSAGGTAATDGIIMVRQAGTANIANDATGWTGEIRIFPRGTSFKKQVTFTGTYDSASAGFAFVTGGGIWNGGNDAVTALRLIMSSGNITSGTVRLYGLRNS